jgi:hypothetical protein
MEEHSAPYAQIPVIPAGRGRLLSMIAVLVVLAVLVVGVVVALVISRRTRPDAPTQPASYAVPAQVDRADFDRPSAPWLVAVFTSLSCASCEGTVEKAAALASDDVVVQAVEFTERRDLHERYDVEAVPMLLVADIDGVVRGSFIGTPSAAELWSAVAGIRENS